MDSPFEQKYILTADIGGSHITAAVCNIADYTIVGESLTRGELMSKRSADEIFVAWNTTLQNTIKKAGVPIAGFGVAMPGPFDYENGISYIKGLNKYEALYGINIKQQFADSLKLEPAQIRFRNDAEATIAGEVRAGAGKGLSNVMGVTLGTGFGSAHCVSNSTRDLNLGSHPFKSSIADDYLSTRWFLKRYYDLTEMSVQGVKDLAMVAAESKVARAVFKEFAVNMTGFLAGPVNQLKPEALIICGNIARASKLFLPHLVKTLSSTTVKLAELNESAALIGAATLFNTID